MSYLKIHTSTNCLFLVIELNWFLFQSVSKATKFNVESLHVLIFLILLLLRFKNIKFSSPSLKFHNPYCHTYCQHKLHHCSHSPSDGCFSNFRTINWRCKGETAPSQTSQNSTHKEQYWTGDVCLETRNQQTYPTCNCKILFIKTNEHKTNSQYLIKWANKTYYLHVIID